MGMGNAPILILREGTKRDKGKDAQYNNITAARAISDAVRSSLGPRGMDKMLVDTMGDVVITNDGVTILKEMDVQHPAAKMLVEVAKTQDAEVGDGTTTSVRKWVTVQRHPSYLPGNFSKRPQTWSTRMFTQRL
jgi:Chaperonin GroEL (HSP60 family)